MTKIESMEAAVRRRVEGLSEAVRARDLGAVMCFYTPDNIVLELDPPLRYTGTPNKRRAWREFFDLHQGDIGYDVRDLKVSAQGDTAFVRSVNRVSAMLPSGNRSEMWVRWTACFKRLDGIWLIAHDHVSVPVRHPGTGAALEPAPVARFG
jgi:ketosteroid isomerase-like protein